MSTDDRNNPMFVREPEPKEFYRVDRPDPQLGFPELWWRGKRPFNGVHYYPAQQKETHGAAVDGWRNQLFWGDNLQVIGHLLRRFRGKVDLVYIDPPFDSKADYKRRIELRGKKAESDSTGFEEKQYGDIWTNDEYLQFIFERLCLIRELLAPKGSIYLHCDWHKAHHLRALMDEVFGPSRFVNEVIWHYSGAGVPKGCWAKRHDNLFLYSRGAEWCYNADAVRTEYAAATVERFSHTIRNVRNGVDFGAQELNPLGKYPEDVLEVSIEAPSSNLRTGYPTQKPEALLEKLIKASSKPGDLVFDCFMGSGTTQAVAMKLGRRFIGADINLGAIQTTTKRLLGVSEELRLQPPNLFESEGKRLPLYTGFDVHTVNQYDVFRNELEARGLLMEALAIRPLAGGDVWHGELGEGSDTRLVRFMPINRIATRADLDPIVKNLDWKALTRRRTDAPNKPVLRVSLVCMGHEPELAGLFAIEIRKGLGDTSAKLDIEVVDILRDKDHIEFKRDSHAEAIVKDGRLVIGKFYPMNLLQKLSLDKTAVTDWRELVESVFVDFNYDGKVLKPAVTDIADAKTLVIGTYEVPKGAGVIRIKITDLLSDILEFTVEAPRG